MFVFHVAVRIKFLSGFPDFRPLIGGRREQVCDHTSTIKIFQVPGVYLHSWFCAATTCWSLLDVDGALLVRFQYGAYNQPGSLRQGGSGYFGLGRQNSAVSSPRTINNLFQYFMIQYSSRRAHYSCHSPTRARVGKSMEARQKQTSDCAS